MKFLRNVLSTVVGVFLSIILLFIFFFAFMAIVSAIGGDGTVKVKEKSILKLDLDRLIKDHAYAVSPFEESFGFADPTMGLDDIVQAIEYAETDERIKGISIQDGFVIAGIAQTKAIRDALLKFKESGKFIYAYGDFYSQKDYYLGSAADSIFINPQGEMDFRGLSSEVIYLKDLQEKSGIKMEVIRHGKYKSAVEPFLENEMSEANREQISVFLQSIWNEMLAEIGDSRSLSTQQLNEIADELGARSPELAIENRIIDGVSYMDEYEALLRKASDIEEDDDLRMVSIKDYIKKAKPDTDLDASKIAILYAQGEIMYAKGDEDIIGQVTMTKAIRKIKEDEDIKAVVLRVNSPGGSALASELIWREIELLKEEKPVIVSMGNVAASGGYYIACNADKIVAEPTTITGSIGVFGTLPNLKGLADKIGMNAEQVGTNERASGYSLFEPLSDDFRSYVKEGIEDIYSTFLKRVADGRGMTVAEVDSIAQGRVWAGTDAIKNGLVDELGGLDVALKLAAEAADLEEYRTVDYPKFKKDFFQELSASPLAKAKEKMIKEEIGDEAYEVLHRLKAISRQKGIQARLPFEINIK
ncbi:signal peptide peptidase SppA [Sungkyunkwania multivorans]|uniref:Signal peptide peptidase SppA n=1 Tax=Sungkyunkwania multivorans TaxID=1173618 RepID=A0ABW3D1C4_9FLAO